MWNSGHDTTVRKINNKQASEKETKRKNPYEDEKHSKCPKCDAWFNGWLRICKACVDKTCVYSEIKIVEEQEEEDKEEQQQPSSSFYKWTPVAS
eukprot:Pgem_evm1s5138